MILITLVFLPEDKDIITLITGPLSTGTDSDNVQWLLKQAKKTQDAGHVLQKC